jgi:hypothetical protein
MAIAGNQSISCQTTGGILEFAVKRTDVPMLLHYIDSRIQATRKDRLAPEMTVARRAAAGVQAPPGSTC